MADEPTSTAADEPAADPQPDTEPSDASATQADEGDSQKQDDTFIDDAALLKEVRADEKLNRFFSKMQGAFTKKTQQIAEVRNAADVVRRFDSDPEFAKETISKKAAQLGLQVGPANAAPAATPHAKAPPELVEAIRNALPEEVKWMAEGQANGIFAGQQALMRPIEQQAEQDRRTRRARDYEDISGELSEKVPGWEEQEDTMNELLAFLQGPEMKSRKFGSKLELLHRMTTANEGATADAVRRIGQAAKSRTSSSQATRQTTDNLAEQIQKAPNNRAAWKIAQKVAEQEAAKLGISV